MRFDILTIFPEILDSYINESIIKRAQEGQHCEIYTHDIRKFAGNKHNKVDDKPYGGGVGMIMRAEPIYGALQSVPRIGKSCIVLLSPAGQTWRQESAWKFQEAYDQIIFICGRYEGIDARINEFVDYQVSIGNYVLTGGELPAMIMIDSIVRLIPGVLGSFDSVLDESHAEDGYGEYPQYTRPEVLELAGKELAVPDVLLSGHHKNIEQWKIDQAKRGE
jgi:tRNA (guanine37-N1)-methyltransferase